MDFWFPALAMIGVFWISCLVIYYVVKGQLRPIVQSLKRIERQLGGGRTTQDYVTESVPQPHQPLPPRSRYVTVEKEMRW